MINTLKILNLGRIVVIVLIISACTDNKTANEYLSEAEMSVQANNHAQAIIQLKNAVVIEPKNGDIRTELAKSYLSRGSYVLAEKEFNRAKDSLFEARL